MRVSALVLSFLALASGVSAQTEWRPLPSGSIVSVDALAAISGGEFSLSSESQEVYDFDQTFSAMLVSVRKPVTPRLTAVGTLPFAFYDINADLPAEANVDTSPSVGIGNPYIGAAFAAAPEASLEAGVWLPLSTDDSFYSNRESYNFAVGTAGSTTDTEHFEAYAKDALSARLLFSGGADVSPAVRVRGSVAPVFAYYIGNLQLGTDGPRTNLAVTGGAFVDGRAGPVTITGGATGRYEPEGGRYSLVDAAHVNALGAVAVEGLPVRPGLLVRVPVAGFNVVDAIVGLTLDVPLR